MFEQIQQDVLTNESWTFVHYRWGNFPLSRPI